MKSNLKWTVLAVAISATFAAYADEEPTPADPTETTVVYDETVNINDTRNYTTNVDDTLERMQQLHPVLDQVRNDPALALSSIVYRLLTVLPRSITTNIAGSLMKGVDVAATNVPGPPIPVYCAGSKVEALIPFAPKAGAAVNIGLMSYDGVAYVGINCDPAAVTDPELFTECFRQAVENVIDL